jgi:hypothetical protein
LIVALRTQVVPWLPRSPGSLIEQAERAGQRVLELERRVGELQAAVDQRVREILALRDSLRQTIRERNTGSSSARCPPLSRSLHGPLTLRR